MPFGGAVMLMTLVARIALFPLFIRSRSKMHTVIPRVAF